MCGSMARHCQSETFPTTGQSYHPVLYLRADHSFHMFFSILVCSDLYITEVDHKKFYDKVCLWFFFCVCFTSHFFLQIYIFFVKVSDRWEVCVSVRFIHWVFIVSLLIWNNKPIFYFLKNFKKINHKYWCRFRMDKHNKLVLWILFARPKVERT